MWGTQHRPGSERWTVARAVGFATGLLVLLSAAAAFAMVAAPAGATPAAGGSVSAPLGTGAALHVASEPGLTLVPDPAANIAPSQTPEDFLSSQYCTFGNGVLDNSTTCTTAALDAINYAHGIEGVAALTLPSDWYRLTSAEQLVTVINLERVAVGLPAAVGLTTALDQVSLTGATDGTDPALAPPSGAINGGSIWAGNYPNALAADFAWLYDDGWGGSPQTTPNGTCTSATAAGCWGHREVVLAECQAAGVPNADCQVVAGAAEATDAGTAPPVSSFAAEVMDTTGAVPPLDYTYPSAPAATTTKITVHPAPAAFGSSVTYGATVTAGHGSPAGSVAFTLGTMTLCTAVLAGGTGSCTATTAPVGTDTVTGTYLGGWAFGVSTATTTLTVTRSPTTSTLTSSPATVVAGSIVTFTDKVSPDPAGGTAKFTSDGTAIAGCKAVVVNRTTAKATCKVTFDAAGTFSVKAAYAGDAHFAPSTSSTVDEVVTG